MNYRNETTLNHYKVVTTRQHGEEQFDVVVTEPLADDPMDATVLSHIAGTNPFRTTVLTNMPSAHYGGQSLNRAQVGRLAKLLQVVECVMSDIHQTGLEYDAKKAKRLAKRGIVDRKAPQI